MPNVKAFQNEFRPELVDHIINQLRKGETTALIGIAGVGKTNTVHWIKKRALKKNSILIIHLDLNNLLNSEDLGLFRLLLLELHRSISKQIFDKELIKKTTEIYEDFISTQDNLLTFDAVKRIFQEIINFTDIKICTILDGFEKLDQMNISIFNSLTALRSLDKTRIVYLFVGNADISTIFSPKKTGELYALLDYNKHWLRLLNKEETFLLSEEFSNLLDAKCEKTIQNKVWELSGGHAWYIKVLTKLLTEKEIEIDSNAEEIANLSSIKSRAIQIWASVEKENKEKLQKLVTNPSVSEAKKSEYLLKIGLIRIEKKEVLLFSPIFTQFIRNKVNKNGYSTNERNHLKGDSKDGFGIDLERRIVIKHGNPIKRNFTRNEFKLIKYFIENESLAITRDDISEVVWGKDAIQKYSEWAIDKLISRVREKIEDNPSKPVHLITLRGIGFKFVN